MICQDGLWLTEGAADLETFPWPEGAAWSEARAWLEPMVREGPEIFVRNARTTLHLLRAGEAVLPVTVDDPGPERSYVVSPWAQYVAYAAEEAARLPKPWQRLGAAGLLAGLKLLLRQERMDRVVQVNNWLVSTNLWPQGMEPWVAGIAALLRARWPDRAVIFRSIDGTAHPGMPSALGLAGARMIFSRVVTWQDPQSGEVIRNRQLRNDRKKWSKEGWEIRPVGPDSEDGAAAWRGLYAALYLEKYSAWNPDFTERFFREAAVGGFVRMEELRDAAGELRGVWGWWARDGVMTQPVFGYDPAGPWGAKPYAALSLQVLERAGELGFKVNASGGAGHFKQQRGGVAAVEFHAVFDAHLPFRARLPWIVLEKTVGPKVREWLRKSGL